MHVGMQIPEEQHDKSMLECKYQKNDMLKACLNENIRRTTCYMHAGMQISEEQHAKYMFE